MIPAAANEVGRSIDDIAMVLTIATATLLLLVAALMGIFCWRYRKGSKASRASRISSSWTIEAVNFSVILILGLVVFFWSARIFYRQFVAPADALDLYVNAKQWMWTFQYPGGREQIGHIEVPLGRPVRLLLYSDDVIHSFFLPAFRIKQDALPGRYTSLWFQADRLGEFTVLCSEFCGTSHSSMRATIEVVPGEKFRRVADTAISGHGLYKKMDCNQCHDNGKIAPDLRGLFGKKVALEGGRTILADEDYLRLSLLEPSRHVTRGYRDLMPTYRGQLSETEIRSLLEYLKSLKGGG